MSKNRKNEKVHFELTPANRRRLDEYLKFYNENPMRVTPKWKIADVVNAALDKWLTRLEV